MAERHFGQIAAPVFHTRVGRFVCVRVWFLPLTFLNVTPDAQPSAKQQPMTNRSHKNNTIHRKFIKRRGSSEKMGKKTGTEAGADRCIAIMEVLEEFKLFALPAGLLTTPAFDQSALESSFHRPPLNYASSMPVLG